MSHVEVSRPFVRVAVTMVGAVAQAVFSISLERFANAHHGSIDFPLWMLMLPVAEVIALPAVLFFNPRWLALTGRGLITLAAVLTALIDAIILGLSLLLGLTAQGLATKYGGTGVHPGVSGYLTFVLALLAIGLNVAIMIFAWIASQKPRP